MSKVAVFHGSYFHSLNPVIAENTGSLAGKVERDVKIIQALDYVPGKPCGVRHYFYHSLDITANPAHPSGHY
jgi:hypothetical protein